MHHPARSTCAACNSTPSWERLPAEPPTLLVATPQPRTGDWLALFARVSLRHQALLRATLARAAGEGLRSQ